MQRRKFLIYSAAFGASTACAARTEATNGDNAKGVWSPRANMPFPVQEIYPAAFVRGDAPIIVNAGGLTPVGAFNVTDAVTVYDPQKDEWANGQTLPAPRHHVALASVNNALFAIGGFARDAKGGWQMQRTVWRIEDIDTGEWISVAELPAPQAEAVTLAHNGLIHMIGGRTPEGAKNLEWNDQSDTGMHVAYDPASDEWTPRAPLPTPRNSAAGAVIDGILYVISGRTVTGGNTPVCETYDPTGDTWRTIAPLPKPVRQTSPRGQGGLAAAAIGGRLYAFGGEWFSGGAGVYADAWEYDPAKDEWRAVAAMARPRHGLGAVAIGETVYVIGGASRAGGDGTTAFVDVFRT